MRPRSSRKCLLYLRQEASFAFKWNSPEHGMLMYLKFCLAGNARMEHLVLYSFHEDRP